MQVRECVAKDAGEYALDVVRRGSGLFRSKETRDAVYAALKEHKDLRITRGNVSNQQLHPEYVTDYVGRLETGFGNMQYQTFWSKLYSIDISRR